MPKPIEAMTLEELIYEIRMGARGEIGFADGPAEEELMRRFSAMVPENKIDIGRALIDGQWGWGWAVVHPAQIRAEGMSKTREQAEVAAKAWINEHEHGTH